MSQPVRQTYTYKSVEGLGIQADVYAAAAQGLRPTIVWIHGGALITGGRQALPPWQRDRYLGEGWHVVSVDYRLAPETKLPLIVEDIRDAISWARTEGSNLFGADPERIAVVGHSAGGYLTLMAGVAVRPRPRVLVSFYGYGDIVGDWYSRPDPYYCQWPAVSPEEAWACVGHAPLANAEGETRERFYLWCRQQGRWPHEVVGADPSADPEAFSPFCPVRNITSDYPPTMLLHGDADTDVPYEQSEMMARALAAAGVLHELVTIPGGAHGFDAEETPAARAALDRVIAFLHHYL